MSIVRVLSAAALVTIAAMSAQATTVSVTTDVMAYTGATDTPTSTTGNVVVGQVDTGITNGWVWAVSAWAGTSAQSTGLYNAVLGNGTAEYVYDVAHTAFSVFWGTPDWYNTLSFFDSVGTQLFSMSGTDVMNAAGGQNAMSYNVSITDLSPFTRVVLSSGTNSFEYAQATAAAPIPLPMTALSLIAGLGALSLIARARKA